MFLVLFKLPMVVAVKLLAVVECCALCVESLTERSWLPVGGISSLVRFDFLPRVNYLHVVEFDP